MGMMFSMMGMVLLALGITTRSRPGFYASSLGIDANLWWGIVLLCFGLVVMILGRRGQARMDKQQQGAPDNSLARRKTGDAGSKRNK
jgi:membrane protein implicated in regulation of membrane protease activity